jgi:hypothetical protein
MKEMNYYKSIILMLVFNVPGCSQNQLFDSRFSVTVSINSSPSKVAVDDFNKDSFNDIMIASDSGLVILLNDGEGNFTQSEGSPFRAGNKPADIGLADFNGDGNTDAAIPNHERDEISILFGDGSGRFRKSFDSSLRLDLNPHAHSVAAGDLNSDKNVDLVVTSFLGAELIIVFGDGRGGFHNNTSTISVPRYPYRNVVIFDIDKDGNPDIITPANNRNSVSVLKGNGKGTFTFADGSPYEIGDNPFFVTAADFNDDGHSDIMATNFDSGTVSILPGNEGNAFAHSNIKSFKTGLKPVYIAAGDLNMDGVTDAVCANYESNDISILIGSKPETINPDILNIPVGTSPYGAAIGDLNGDGLPDIVTANYESNDITILFNRGSQ